MAPLKTLRLVLLLVLAASTMGCAELNKPGLFVYDYETLRNAWATNDSTYLREWVAHLAKEDFAHFRGRAVEFATTGNFCYGYLDEERPVAKYSRHEQTVIKRNIILLDSIYLKSRLLLNKKMPFDSTLFIQDKYWRDTRVLSKEELADIATYLERICR